MSKQKFGELYRTEDGIYLHVCSICNQEYSLYNEMLQHIEINHILLSSLQNEIPIFDENQEMFQQEKIEDEITAKNESPTHYNEKIYDYRIDITTLAKHDASLKVPNNETDFDAFMRDEAKDEIIAESESPRIERNASLQIPYTESDFDAFMRGEEIDEIKVENESPAHENIYTERTLTHNALSNGPNNESYFDTFMRDEEENEINAENKSPKSTHVYNESNVTTLTKQNASLNDNKTDFDIFMKTEEKNDITAEIKSPYNENKGIDSIDDRNLTETNTSLEMLNNETENELKEYAESQITKLDTKSKNRSEFKCNICGLVSNEKRIILNHLYNKHIGLSPNTCKICNLQLTSASALKKHQRALHIKSLPANIQIVDADTLDATTLTENNTSLEKPNNKTTEAELKEYAVTQYTIITRKKGERSQYKCNICSQIYNHRTYVLNHLYNKHIGLSPNTCKICNLQLSSDTRLVNHYKSIHSISKLSTNVENVCDNAIITSLKIPNNAKDLKEYAETQFKSMKNKYTNRPEYKCNICDAVYGARRNMVNHLYNKHFGRLHSPHTCKICHLQLGSSASLTNHLKCLHNNAKNDYIDILSDTEIPTALNSKLSSIDVDSDILIDNGDNNKDNDESRNSELNSNDSDDNDNVSKNLMEENKKSSTATSFERVLYDYANDKNGFKEYAANRYERIKNQYTKRAEYKCSICSIKFKEIRLVYNHLYNKHFNLKLSSASIESDPLIDDNSKDNYKNDDFNSMTTNDLKKYAETQFTRIKNDITNHSNFKCNLCDCDNRIYKHKVEVLNHLYNKHFGRSPHTCEICNLELCTNMMLKKHLKSFHSNSNLLSVTIDNGDDNNDDDDDDDDDDDPTEQSDETKFKKWADTQFKTIKDDSTNQKTETQCNICDKTFKHHSQRSVISHLYYQHYRIAPNRCKMCKVQLRSAIALQIHYKSFHGIDEDNIDKLPEKQLSTHPVVESVIYYQCVECNINFSSTRALQMHRKDIHSASLNSTELSTTQLKTVQIKPYIIDIINQETQPGINLKPKPPPPIKKPPPEYKCNECMQIFNRKAHLKEHLKNDHTFDPKSYKCEHCSVTYAYKHQLLYHTRSKHTFERPYKCDKCPKTFVSKPYLNEHLRVSHLHLRRIVCEFCGISCKNSTGYKFHIRSRHTFEKPHKCDQCEQSFSTRKLLSDHQQWHADERSYNCEICDENFQNPKLLRTHKKLHINIKKYPCQYCDQSFFQLKERKFHERSTHHIIPINFHNYCVSTDAKLTEENGTSSENREVAVESSCI